jgi:hypothetical protein
VPDTPQIHTLATRLGPTAGRPSLPPSTAPKFPLGIATGNLAPDAIKRQLKHNPYPDLLKGN